MPLLGPALSLVPVLRSPAVPGFPAAYVMGYESQEFLSLLVSLSLSDALSV